MWFTIPKMVWYCKITPHLILNVSYLFITATLDLRFFYVKMDKSELMFGRLTGALKQGQCVLQSRLIVHRGRVSR
jgi:hypothetical protein